MSKLFFILIVLISIESYGQNYKPEFIGINLSPDYCFRNLSNGDGGYLEDESISKRNNIEKPKLGYTAGVHLRDRKNQYVDLEFGLEFSNKGYKFEDLNVPNSWPYNYPPSSNPIIHVIGSYNYYFIDVPVRFIITSGQKKINFVASGSIAMNIFLVFIKNYKEIRQNGEVSTGFYQQSLKFRTINFSPTFSLGINYKLSDKLIIEMTPIVRYGLFTTYPPYSINEHLWSRGLNTTLYYTLR